MRTFGRAVLRENKWVFEELDTHVSIRLKAIFHKIPRAAVAPNIMFSASEENCRELEWFMQRFPIQMTDEDRRKLVSSSTDFKTRLFDLDKLYLPEYKPRAYALRGELRAYQAFGVDLFLKNKHILCGDDLGLGKTLMAIGAATETSTLPMLVIVQTHLPKQWREKFNEFLPNARLHLIKGRTPYKLPPAEVYIMKYSCLQGWADVFATGSFKTAVYDEIQELRKPDSQKYQSAMVLSQNAEYVLGLSATPIYNKGDEAHSVWDIIKPGCLGEREDFLREWCRGNYHGVVADPKALGMHLRENHLFLRRTRKEVGRELPPVNRIVHQVDCDQEEVDSKMALAKMLATKVTTGSFFERGQAARELDIMMRMMTGVAKAKFVAEYVKILLDNKEPLILAGWHRDVYDIWLEELKDYKPAMYTGSESGNEKALNAEKFLNGETDLLIFSLRSGAGLDGLQRRGKIVVFGELDWSPAVHEQLIGRLNRDGQDDQVTAIYLISDSGSDPPMVDQLGLKASQQHGIIDPLLGVAAAHSDESRIKLLAESVLRRG